MKELKFEELTLRQKLGLTFSATMQGERRTDEDDAFVLDLIRNRSLGAVWIQKEQARDREYLAKVQAAADYPLLILTDAESGIGEFLVGKHNAIGCTGSEKHAYAFGKVVGTLARQRGYTVVCDPLLDMYDGNQRCLGDDREKVAALAAAEARGLHDGGVLTVGKHYPSPTPVDDVDTHMAESVSEDTKEKLLEYNLYPYRKLSEAGLLDGVMTNHCRLVNIDPEHPATLSKPVIDVFRETGYEGFIITDALCMMGIRAKYGDVVSKGLCLSAGVDLLLPYSQDNQTQFAQYCAAYEQGLVPDDMLDEAVKRVLAAQHKVTLLPQHAELTEEDIETFRSINRDGVYTRVDQGLSHTISREGKHMFIVVAEQDADIASGDAVDVDTFSGGWNFPGRITKKIRALFPNSRSLVIHQFPSQEEMMLAIKPHDCEELVFLTFSEQLAYTGPEHLTTRLISLIDAMQRTDRISTVVHLGNPHVLETLPHIPRYIFGGLSADSVDACLEVLAGEYPPNGTPTYEFTLR